MSTHMAKQNVKSVFIINPLSHSVAKSGALLHDGGLQDCAPIYNLEDFAQLPACVEEILSSGYTHVFIEGGDGTIHGVLSQFLNARPDVSRLPKFTLLPGGMTNLVAAHIGLQHKSVAKIKRLVCDHQNGHCVDLPLLCVRPINHEQNSDQAYYGFLLSTGALPAATRYCVNQVHTRGIGGSAAVRQTLLRVLLHRGPERDIILRPTPLGLTLNQIDIRGEHIVSIATTLPRLMIGLNPFWGTGQGAIRISHVEHGAQHLLGNIVRMLLPRQSPAARAALKKDGFQSWNTDNAVFELAGEIVLDGEFLPLSRSKFSLTATPPLIFVR